MYKYENAIWHTFVYLSTIKLNQGSSNNDRLPPFTARFLRQFPFPVSQSLYITPFKFFKISFLIFSSFLFCFHSLNDCLGNQSPVIMKIQGGPHNELHLVAAFGERPHGFRFELASGELPLHTHGRVLNDHQPGQFSTFKYVLFTSLDYFRSKLFRIPLR